MAGSSQQNTNPAAQGVKPTSFFKGKRLTSARVHEFEIIDKFKYGYRNREDQTNLPPGVLVVGSKNVLTNVSERIQARPGYALDGPTSAVIASIDSSFTTDMILAGERNLRTYFTTPGSATSATVEYRYVDSAGAVTWRTLLSGLTSSSFNYTLWWDADELLNEILMVNGTANVYEWGGGITTIASVTANTITTADPTKTWAQLGFYHDNTSHATRKITINGIDFAYTGGETTQTLTGVSGNPTGFVNPGDIAHQTPIITASGALTNLGLAQNDLIQSFNRQLWIGSLYDQTVYVSNVDNYKDYTTSAIGQTGYGKTIQLDSAPVAFIALENSFTISAGKNQWYQTSITTTTFNNSATNVNYYVDTFLTNRLKTNSQAAAQSQAMTSAMKNDVMFISNEPTMDTLGRVENILGSTQTTNMSDPIKLDFDSYDFTDGSIFYNKYFVYIAVPQEGLVRIFNIVKNYWEAPQTIPVSRFYTVAGQLYGHSYLTPESYQLFTGAADRVTSTSAGSPIPCNVTFSYQNFASPFTLKQFNKFYIEGYISSNTTLTLGITYDIDGCATQTAYQISGSNKQYVCGHPAIGSLGKESLGKVKLGGDVTTSSADVGNVPPKFRLIQTFPGTDFFESQISFTSSQVGASWELLRFGPALEYSDNIPGFITV